MRFLPSTLTATAFATFLLVAPGTAQDTPPAADPADVESIDAVVKAAYDAISGPAGQKRDWDRFRSLFIEGARLIPTGRRPDGTVGHRVMSPDQFVATSGAGMEERGFFENEIGRVTERYGPVVHLFSAYESRNTLDDPEPFARGVNSFQLLHDGSRWWIVTIFWHGESDDNPIPAKYLVPAGG